MEFTHIHYSLLNHGAALSALENALEKYTQQCSVMSFTEVKFKKRSDALATQGWDYFNPKSPEETKRGLYDDPAIMWDTSKWLKQWTDRKELDHTRVPYGGGTIRGAVGVMAGLKNKSSGHTLLILATHLPPGANQANVRRLWNESYDTCVTWLKDKVRAKKPDLVILTADWNLDARQKATRDFMGGKLSSLNMKLSFKDFPSEGTRVGSRIIDFDYYSADSMKTGGTTILAKTAASDHKAIKTKYETTKAASNPVSVTQDGTASSSSDTVTRAKSIYGTNWWSWDDYDTTTDEMYEIQIIPYT